MNEGAAILEKIDRAHFLPIKRNDKNSVIVKFKSFTDRNSVYKKRRDLPDSKFLRLSLTKRRYDLLTYAKKMSASFDRVKHVYADANCNLKLVLQDGNYTRHIRFNTELELASLLAKEAHLALLSEDIDVNEILGEENSEPMNIDLYI